MSSSGVPPGGGPPTAGPPLGPAAMPSTSFGLGPPEKKGSFYIVRNSNNYGSTQPPLVSNTVAKSSTTSSSALPPPPPPVPSPMPLPLGAFSIQSAFSALGYGASTTFDRLTAPPIASRTNIRAMSDTAAAPIPPGGRVIYAEPDELSLQSRSTIRSNSALASHEPISLRVIYAEPDDMSVHRVGSNSSRRSRSQPAPNERIIYAEPDEISLQNYPLPIMPLRGGESIVNGRPSGLQFMEADTNQLPRGRTLKSGVPPPVPAKPAIQIQQQQAQIRQQQPLPLQRIIYAEPDEISIHRTITTTSTQQPPMPITSTQLTQQTLQRIIYNEPDEISIYRAPTSPKPVQQQQRVLYSEPDEISIYRAPTVNQASALAIPSYQTQPVPPQRIIYSEPDEVSVYRGPTKKASSLLAGHSPDRDFQPTRDGDGRAAHTDFVRRQIFMDPDESSLYRGPIEKRGSVGDSSSISILQTPRDTYGAFVYSEADISPPSPPAKDDDNDSQDSSLRREFLQPVKAQGGIPRRTNVRFGSNRNDETVNSLKDQILLLQQRLEMLERVAGLKDIPATLMPKGSSVPLGGTSEGALRLTRTSVSSNSTWEKLFGYARAVRKGPYIAVSGCTSTDWDTGILLHPGNAFLQAKTAFGNIARALSALGSSMKDVIRTRMYVTHMARDSEIIGTAHLQAFEAFGGVMPAATMVECRMINPKMLVEIEADAVCDDGGTLRSPPDEQ